MTADRWWCPERWCDETMPTADAPSRFLVKRADGWHLEGRLGERVWSDRIVPGEVVAFSYGESRGRFAIAVDWAEGAGGFHPLGPVPIGAGIFYWLPGAADSVSDLLETLVEDSDLEHGTTHEVEAVFWSEPILFRFDVGTDLGWFTPVDDRAPFPITPSEVSS